VLFLGVALSAAGLGVALLPVAWHAYIAYQDARISPVIASTEEFQKILAAVLEQSKLNFGAPPPPPEPGDPPRRDERNPVVLLDETITFCKSKQVANASCQSDEDETIFIPDLTKRFHGVFAKS
jgi:hypothetical protein